MGNERFGMGRLRADLERSSRCRLERGPRPRGREPEAASQSLFEQQRKAQRLTGHRKKEVKRGGAEDASERVSERDIPIFDVLMISHTPCFCALENVFQIFFAQQIDLSLIKKMIIC